MARIQIGERWRIESDERSWQVLELQGSRRAKSKAEIAEYGDGAQVPDWVALTWHPTPEQAAESLAQRLTRRSDAEGLEAIRQTLDAHRERIGAALDAVAGQ